MAFVDSGKQDLHDALREFQNAVRTVEKSSGGGKRGGRGGEGMAHNTYICTHPDELSLLRR